MNFNYLLRGIILTAAASPFLLQAQTDTSTWKRNLHFQQTIVTQGHSNFSAPYTGTNSLLPQEDAQTSLTTTLFLAGKLSKSLTAYINAELAGGAGISLARGVAGFTNGETFRVGDPKPQVYIARVYIRGVIPLTAATELQEDAPNCIAERVPLSYIAISAGKFGIADFIDQNRYSHDPRSQFLNWSLMGNGAWDYPANTRGYTWGVMIEYITPGWVVRFASTLVPKEANGPYLDLQADKSRAESIELEKHYSIGSRKGSARIMGFFNQAHMGNYKDATNLPEYNLDITLNRAFGRSKYGAGINIEQEITPSTGLFARASWNDGRNETWAFTEIDQSASAGIVINGKSWKRPFDNLGIAAVANGISQDHRDYLKAGGYGFIIGDGALNYSTEFISELYYSGQVHQNFWITPDLQLVINPAYNRDRKGPVLVYALRGHFEF